MSKQALTPHERLLIMQAVTWIKTIHDARPAGAAPSYPGAADLDSSALFRRIRQGLAPMPWAPPTRQRHPAYELIENARGEHRVHLGTASSADSIDIDGALWRRLEGSTAAGVLHVAFGHWPVAYRLEARDRPRWPTLPADLDDGPGHDVVRFPDGRLVPKDLLRRTRDEREMQWWLRCVSPLDEQLYLVGERLPLEDPAQFRPIVSLRVGDDGRPRRFTCALRAGPAALFALARDPWTGVTRYLAVPLPAVGDVADAWQDAADAGASALLDVIPAGDGWRVFELDEYGAPCSAWRTARRELLLPVEGVG